jgi:hypothetical protein
MLAFWLDSKIYNRHWSPSLSGILKKTREEWAGTVKYFDRFSNLSTSKILKTNG